LAILRALLVSGGVVTMSITSRPMILMGELPPEPFFDFRV
jgi:hypothetical protein